jgi:two-component system KDP operon response regulator KdpE
VAEENASSLFAAGDLEVDLARRQTRVAGQSVHLTPTEYRLLTLLIKNAGRVITQRQLLKEVWGPDCTHEAHYLRVYVNQLRKKLGDNSAAPRLIITEPGIGYRFSEPDAAFEK